MSTFAGDARARGFTLIEVAISLAILGLLIAMGLPGFVDWIRNTQVRATGEGLTAALQTARGEAIRGNTTVLFQLTDSLDDSCSTSSTGRFWVISLCPVAGKCGEAPQRDAARPDAGCDDDALILTKGTIEGGQGSQLSIGNGTICFSGLGRVNPLAGNCPAGSLNPAGNVSIAITSTAGSCAKDGGDVRCLQVDIATGGQIRMCDPKVSDADDPRKC